MTVDDALDLLAKLGPLAREQGIESVEFDNSSISDGDVKVRLVKFHPTRSAPLAPAPALAKRESSEPEKPRASFAGRSAEDIRAAIPNWGNE